MIIIRTHPDHIDEVCEHSMHALFRCPRILTPGEYILVSQTVAQRRDNLPPIRFVMQFDRLEVDEKGKTSEIWGRSWPYIIYGRNGHYIRPFDISDIQVSSRNYRQGGPYMYVDYRDEEVICNCGLIS